MNSFHTREPFMAFQILLQMNVDANLTFLLLTMKVQTGIHGSQCKNCLKIISEKGENHFLFYLTEEHL